MENERFDKDVLLNTIVVRGAQFEPLYSNPEFFLQMSDSWWMAHRRTFEKWFDAFDIVYAPLENYDRHEKRTNALNKSENTANSQKEVLDGTSNTTTSNTQVVDSDTTNEQTTVDDGTQLTTEEREDLGHDKVLSGGYTEKGNSDMNHLRNEERSKEKVIGSHNVSGFNSSALLPESQDTSIKDPITTIITEGKGTNGEHSDSYEKNIVYNDQKEHISGKDKIITNEKVDNTEIINGSSAVDTTITDNGSINLKNDDITTITGEGSLTGKEDFNEEVYIHGNIGVTTSQQMLKSELDIQLWNEFNHIADLFINDLCTRVY